MTLVNVFTRETEPIPIPRDPAKSIEQYPANEDFNMVCEVTEAQSTTIKAKKVWDQSATPKEFNVSFPEPGGILPEVGSTIVLNRVGDFNSPGVTTPERHVQNNLATSFYTYPFLSTILIEDLGANKLTEQREGRQVLYDSAYNLVVPPWSQTLKIIPHLPANSYRGLNAITNISIPPVKTGRVYMGQRIGNLFLVYLPSFGDLAETIATSVVASGTTFDLELDIDGQGNLLDFRFSAPQEVKNLDDKYIFAGYSEAIATTPNQGGRDFFVADTGLRTEGTAASYRVIFEAWSLHDFTSPHTEVGHVFDQPASWKFKAYQNFDPVTDTYTNFIYENPSTTIGTTGTQSGQGLKSILVDVAGTEIANKISFYPTGENPYQSAPEGPPIPAPRGAIEIEEFGTDTTGTATSGTTTSLTDTAKDFETLGLKPGDTINTLLPTRTETLLTVLDDTVTFAAGTVITAATTYTFPAVNRTSTTLPVVNSAGVLQTEESYPIYPKWPLTIGRGLFQQPYYDPVADVKSPFAPVGEFMAIDGQGVATGVPGAHVGLNDEATTILVFWDTLPFDERNHFVLPGFTQTQPNESKRAKTFAEAKFVLGHGFIGGRIFISRKRTDWFHFDKILGEWVPGIVDDLNFAAFWRINLRVAEKWLTFERTSNRINTWVVLL